MRWRVRFLDVASRCVAERVFVAPTAEAVRTEIVALGHVPIRIGAERWSFARDRIAPLDLRSFCLEFRALLQAGLGIVGSLEALAEAQSTPAHRDGVGAVLRQVQQGKALSQAMTAAEQLFPPILRAAVSAGEASGTLADSVQRFAEYLSAMNQLRQSVISAAIYPAVVVAFGGAVVLFLLAFVIPRFASAYESLPELHASSAVLLQASAWVSAHLQLFLIGFIGLAWAVGRYVRSEAGRVVLWRTVCGIKPIAEAVRAYWMARLFRTVSMMLAGGYSVPEALALGRQVLGATPWVADVEAASAQVSVGKSVSSALMNTGLVRGLTQRLVSAGDASGNLSEMLQHAAEHHERQLALLVERATRVVEPVLLIGVAGVIGVIVLMMYMPIFDLASTLR